MRLDVMDSLEANGSNSNSILSNETIPVSSPAIENINESANQSSIANHINDSPRSCQNDLSQSIAITQEASLLAAESNDLPHLPVLQLNQQLLSPQAHPILSSDFGDLIGYDELSQLSPVHNPIQTNSQPVVLDLTDSSPVTVPQETGKRPATSLTDERPIKAARVGNSKDAGNTSAESNEEIDVVDLSGIENMAQWEEKKAKDAADAIKAHNHKEANKPFKLSSFQCIICMDSPTDLTITHCGHLFCSECLHQALFAGDKKCCPVCRSMINLPRTGGRSGKNGIFALEMKLMKAHKKDKLP